MTLRQSGAPRASLRGARVMGYAAQMSPSPQPEVQVDRRATALDLAVVLGTISLAWLLTRYVLYPALHVPSHAPMILRPISGFFACWWLLHRRNLTFRSLGLRKPPNLLLALLSAVALYFCMQAVSRWVSPWLSELLHPQSQPSFIGYVHGNLIAFIGWLAIGVVIGGFCEEVLFRGFLLNRVENLVGGWFGTVLGVLGQALLFGALHWYGGSFAFAHASVFALVNGCFYLLLKRNLWPLIIVHAAWNAIGIWGVYTG